MASMKVDTHGFTDLQFFLRISFFFFLRSLLSLKIIHLFLQALVVLSVLSLYQC